MFNFYFKIRKILIVKSGCECFRLTPLRTFQKCNISKEEIKCKRNIWQDLIIKGPKKRSFEILHCLRWERNSYQKCRSDKIFFPHRFNLNTTMINCAILNACVLILNTPFWVKKDPHRCSKVSIAKNLAFCLICKI